MKLQVDNKFRVFADGDKNLIGSGTHWPTTYTEDLKPGTKVIGIEAENVVSELRSLSLGPMICIWVLSIKIVCLFMSLEIWKPYTCMYNNIGSRCARLK